MVKHLNKRLKNKFYLFTDHFFMKILQNSLIYSVLLGKRYTLGVKLSFDYKKLRKIEKIKFLVFFLFKTICKHLEFLLIHLIRSNLSKIKFYI